MVYLGSTAAVTTALLHDTAATTTAIKVDQQKVLPGTFKEILQDWTPSDDEDS